MENKHEDLVYESLIDIAFQKSKDQHDWIDTRGLAKGKHGNLNNGYNEFLPILNGRNLYWTINDVAMDYCKNNKGTPLIADYGCGSKGAFLVDCMKELKHMASYTGVNSFFAPNLEIDEKIQLIEGNVQFPEKYFSEGSVDIATCVKVMPYLVDPVRTIININKLLKPNTGKAFVSDIPITPIIPKLKNNEEMATKLFLYMAHKLHMTVEVCRISQAYSDKDIVVNIAWQHNSDVDFRFPLIRTANTITQKFLINENETYVFDSFGYKIDESLLSEIE